MITYARCRLQRISRSGLRIAVPGVLLVAVVVFCAQAASAQGLHWHTRPMPVSAAQSRVSFLEVDPGGYVWCGLSAPDTGSAGTLAVLDSMDEYLFPFSTGHARAVTAVVFESIPDQEPDSGAMWIGLDNGVLVVDRSGRTTALSAGNSPLPPGGVRTIYCGRDNTKWIAVSGRGVTCVDAAFNWASYNRAAGLGSDYVDAILEDHQGNLWFGTHNQGVSRLDRQGAWMRFTSANSGLISNRVIQIVEEKPGRLWFLTPEGISVFDGLNWMSYTPRNTPLGKASATCMAIDRAGNKWVGTDGAGLLKLDSFGRWTQQSAAAGRLPDDRIAGLTIDDSATLWLATPAGITSMASGARAAAGAEEHFYTPGAPGQDTGPLYPFEQALQWEAASEPGRDVELSWSLPSFPFGGRAWYYGALWADSGFSFDRLYYELRADRSGSQRLLLTGDFSQATFLLHGSMQIRDTPEAAHSRTSPFPERLPEHVAACALPGDHIPADDPLIVQLAGELVQPESRGDMYAILRDIVYSDRIQQLQLEAAPVDTGAVADVASVLINKSGNQHAKARLVCSLARAAGLPARLVMAMDGGVWCQAWVARRGWISIESTYPVFDYIRPVRTGLPKALAPREYAVAAVSARDDTISVLSWDTAVGGTCRSVPAAELQQPDRLRNAHMLFAVIHGDGAVPRHARIPLADALVAYARQRGADVQLVFEDAAGRELHVCTPDLQGLATTVNVSDRLLWRFIVRRLGFLLVIETIDCKEYLPGE